jgi:D-serine deaminase-like pyridoxal phosphate-dependent protein
MNQQDWYKINNIEVLDSPALVIYPKRVEANISTLIGMIDDVKRLRPHIKTSKCREAILLMMQAGIQKFKCATIAEAELLGLCLAPDALLAYQPTGPKLERFVRLIKAYPNTKFSCLVDHSAVAKQLSGVAMANHLQIAVYLDLNVGQNRTGIKPGLDALQLYLDCEALPGIIPLGLHAYDGHIHDADLSVRRQKCDDAFKPVEKLQDRLKERGFTGLTIIAGGSPTFPIHSGRKAVECSPGTFIYWDAGYRSFLEQSFEPAALVVARVISLSGKSRICLDLGHKSVAAENEISKRVFFLNAPELIMVSQSEEHLVADAGKDHHYQIGDVLYGLPYHICPTVALYERAITIAENMISAEWRTIARDRQITI